MKLLYIIKCCDSIAKVVGRCLLQKMNTGYSVGDHMPAKTIQQTCDKPKEFPHNNHLRDLYLPGVSFSLPIPLFFFSANLLCASIVIVLYMTMATMWGQRLLEKRLSTWMDEKAE